MPSPVSPSNLKRTNTNRGIAAFRAKPPNVVRAHLADGRSARSAQAAPIARAASIRAKPANLFYGINIHPQFVDAPWLKSPREVLEDVADLGCTVARIDCYGSQIDADRVLQHAQEAQRTGIQILPCLAYHQAAVQGDSQLNYELGLSYGTTTANVLRKHCPIYEVSNELCIYCNGDGPGTDPARYDFVRYVDCRELIRGTIDGIKSVQPDAKIIIGGGVTTLTAFFRMMWEGTAPDGSTGHPLVRWDYTGWHWYESSADITQAYDGTDTPYNVLEELSRYGVPIWMTELGFIPHGTPEQQCAYVEAALDDYRGYRETYNVMSICWYTLYDDGSGPFGLLLEDAETKKAAHPVFKDYVARNPEEDGAEDPGDDSDTREYTLPLDLYEKLVAAARKNDITENDELVRRLASTFTPQWELYEKLRCAATENGVSFCAEVFERLEAS